jgi:formamidopyrimidine-DNA glycosylase
MPELPEVETTVRGLKRTIVGHTINDVRVVGNSHKLLRSHEHGPFLEIVGGGRIEDVRRRAKNVIIDLDNQHSILIHMRMSGHLLVASSQYQVTSEGKWQVKGPTGNWQPTTGNSPFADPKNQFIRIVFELSDGIILALSDLRKFATVDLFNTNALAKHLEQKYGPDPLEKTFTLDWFSQELKRRKRTIKPLLMDQAFIAGVGNIYADESLWKAKVHPLTRSDALSQSDARALYSAIRAVLSKGIALGGTSDDDYRNVAGEKGKYGLTRMAYRRAGEKCARCNTVMKRMVVGQRGTSFCPHCQKKI